MALLLMCKLIGHKQGGLKVIFTQKTRYKMLGLVRNYEYDSDKRALGDEPAASRLTTYLRPTAFTSTLPMSQHTLKQGESLHHLALHYYNDARLWWFIADYNDGQVEFAEGDTILLPPTVEVDGY